MEHTSYTLPASDWEEVLNEALLSALEALESRPLSYDKLELMVAVLLGAMLAEQVQHCELLFHAGIESCNDIPIK